MDGIDPLDSAQPQMTGMSQIIIQTPSRTFTDGGLIKTRRRLCDDILAADERVPTFETKFESLLRYRASWLLPPPAPAEDGYFWILEEVTIDMHFPKRQVRSGRSTPHLSLPTGTIFVMPSISLQLGVICAQGH